MGFLQQRKTPREGLNSLSGKQQPLRGDVSALTLVLDRGFLCKYPFVSGFIWAEIKEMWDGGFTEYIHDWWNLMDFAMNSLYLATISLKIVAYVKVKSCACAWVVMISGTHYRLCCLVGSGRYFAETKGGRCAHLTLKSLFKGFLLFSFTIEVLFKRAQIHLSN